jgi:hypothetical protein
VSLYAEEQLINLLIIPLTAMCNAARGRGYKLESAAVMASISTVLLWQGGVLPFVIIFAGWYIANFMGTGYAFNAIHGRNAPKWKGTLYGSARGLLKAPMIIALAFFLYHPWASLWSFLGLLDGLCYFLGGLPKENKYSVIVAEILSGAIFGIMIWGAL